MGHPYSVPAVYDEPARAILCTMIAINTTCVVARAASRWIQKAEFAADDYLSYLAYVGTRTDFALQGQLLTCRVRS